METREELKRATEAPYRVLGNGSNLLVLDEGCRSGSSGLRASSKPTT